MNSFTAVSEVPPGGPRIVARFGRADRNRAFRAAVRHSRHVRILRVAVPLTAGVVLLSGVAVPGVRHPLARSPAAPPQTQPTPRGTARETSGPPSREALGSRPAGGN